MAVTGLVGPSQLRDEVRSLSRCWTSSGSAVPSPHVLRFIIAACRVIRSGESIKDRVGQLGYQGDNYRVIGVLTLSALAIFVSSLLTSALHKSTQRVWSYRSSIKTAVGRQATLPAPLGSILSSCVCLKEGMLFHCLQKFVDLLTPVDWLKVEFKIPICCYY